MTGDNALRRRAVGRGTFPWTDRPSAADRARYADASLQPYWLDGLARRASQPPLTGRDTADLCIVGGGYTGLWAAIHAKRDDPSRDVVLLEATSAGAAASGRNGGFASSSLTHGIANGLARFPSEMDALERLGRENLAEMRHDLEELGVDCCWEDSGELAVALEPYQEARLRQEAELMRRFGHDVQVLDRDAVQAQIASPIYRAGLWSHSSVLVDPGRLASGLLNAAKVSRSVSGAVELATDGGMVRARRVVLATGASSLLRRGIGAYVVPVVDHVMATEPLSLSQKASVGWHERQGVSDMGNRFHYYRLTHDDRVVFGGYDAVYRRRSANRVVRHENGEESFARLSEHFATIFPQLEDVRFSHRWSGTIDTCSRFSVFFDTAAGGKIVFVGGYTGLGVAATRFGARVALDLLDGRDTEATRLRYVRSKPVPFPPEPLRTGVIELTRNRLAAADRNAGRRGLWLKTLDRLGLGFDS